MLARCVVAAQPGIAFQLLQKPERCRGWKLQWPNSLMTWGASLGSPICLLVSTSPQGYFSRTGLHLLADLQCGVTGGGIPFTVRRTLEASPDSAALRMPMASLAFLHF